jgi:hypothetical protein
LFQHSSIPAFQHSSIPKIKTVPLFFTLWMTILPTRQVIIYNEEIEELIFQFVFGKVQLA